MLRPMLRRVHALTDARSPTWTHANAFCCALRSRVRHNVLLRELLEEYSSFFVSKRTHPLQAALGLVLLLNRTYSWLR